MISWQLPRLSSWDACQTLLFLHPLRYTVLESKTCSCLTLMWENQAGWTSHSLLALQVVYVLGFLSLVIMWLLLRVVLPKRLVIWHMSDLTSVHFTSGGAGDCGSRPWFNNPWSGCGATPKMGSCRWRLSPENLHYGMTTLKSQHGDNTLIHCHVHALSKHSNPTLATWDCFCYYADSVLKKLLSCSNLVCPHADPSQMLDLFSAEDIHCKHCALQIPCGRFLGHKFENVFKPRFQLHHIMIISAKIMKNTQRISRSKMTKWGSLRH